MSPITMAASAGAVLVSLFGIYLCLAKRDWFAFGGIYLWLAVLVFAVTVFFFAMRGLRISDIKSALLFFLIFVMFTVIVTIITKQPNKKRR